MQLQGGELTASFDRIRATLDSELPSQTKSLIENALNLEKVSQYCEDIYVNSRDSDKQHLLNETKGYTTQALASVAYQIHVLANSYLQLFDTQSVIVADMAESMAHLEHEVKIYKEKIARREIGILTTNKSVTRTVKVKRPDCEEKPVKYIRKPIDYSVLDDIGHGVRLNRQSSVNMDQLSKIGVASVRQNSYTSNTGTISSMPGQMNKPVMEVAPTPPLALKSNMNMNLGNGMGTIRPGGGSSRLPVAPPSVPSEYLSRQELGIYSSKKELNQSGKRKIMNCTFSFILRPNRIYFLD
jgi:abl interactor 2